VAADVGGRTQGGPICGEGFRCRRR
jgi:hypothetical protein